MAELPLPEGVVDESVMKIEDGVKGGCLVLAHVTVSAKDWVSIVDGLLVEATKGEMDGIMRLLQSNTVVGLTSLIGNSTVESDRLPA